MILLYAVSGGFFGSVLGVILKKLREHRQRLDMFHQEFELQVAALRHHYKNLALGIHGFSGRITASLWTVARTPWYSLLNRTPWKSFWATSWATP